MSGHRPCLTVDVPQTGPSWASRIGDTGVGGTNRERACRAPLCSYTRAGYQYICDFALHAATFTQVIANGDLAPTTRILRQPPPILGAPSVEIRCGPRPPIGDEGKSKRAIVRGIGGA